MASSRRVICLFFVFYLVLHVTTTADNFGNLEIDMPNHGNAYEDDMQSNNYIKKSNLNINNEDTDYDAPNQHVVHDGALHDDIIHNGVNGNNHNIPNIQPPAPGNLDRGNLPENLAGGNMPGNLDRGNLPGNLDRGNLAGNLDRGNLAEHAQSIYRQQPVDPPRPGQAMDGVVPVGGGGPMHGGAPGGGGAMHGGAAPGGVGIGGTGLENKPILKKSGRKHPVKISESVACRDDVQRICSSTMTNNNFAVLDCLSNERQNYEDVSLACQNYLWSYKSNLTTDIRFDSAASEVCKSDLEQTECNLLERGTGHVIACLIEHKENMTNTNCRQFLTRMASIVFSDYRLIYKFADSCTNDITRLQCGRIEEHNAPHTQGHTLDCLAEHMRDLEPQCSKQILRVAELQADDYHLDRPLFYACREDRETFCPKTKAGNGKVFRCLYRHKFDREMSNECREKLVGRQQLMRENYKVNHGLSEACRHDIRHYQCLHTDHSITTKHGKLSLIILCLEGVQKEGSLIRPDCVTELRDVRRSLLEDYRISPSLMLACDGDIMEFCGGGVERGGQTIHCLMEHARPHMAMVKQRAVAMPTISKTCMVELKHLLREADPGEDMSLDPILMDACGSIMHTLCDDQTHGEGAVLSCLMEHILSPDMNDECKSKVLEIQYFIARDFKLNAQLYKQCHRDAVNNCNAPDHWSEMEDSVEQGDDGGDDGDTAGFDEGGAPIIHKVVFSCLYQRYKYYDTDPDNQLSRECSHEVRRVMKMRTASVHMNPLIEEPCMQDIATYCITQIETGEGIHCLQDNYRDLGEQCQYAVGNFTQDTEKMPSLDRILIDSCSPMIDKFCPEADEHKLMDCLIENKNSNEMNAKCRAGINHHQIISLQNYKFSVKFKEQCKDDVSRYCAVKKTKADLMRCLSEHIRNDTLLENDHRISRTCRKQMRFEMIQRSEHIDLDPVLKDACEADRAEFCHGIEPGKGKVLECLKQHINKLSPSCSKVIMKREGLAARVGKADYMLNTACKAMIRQYCSDTEPDHVMACLKNYKHNSDFDKGCKAVMMTRQIIRNKDYKLNPLLAKNCKLDITKFCKSQLEHHDNADISFDGVVINCLKVQYSKKRLSHDCEDHIRDQIEDAAMDYRQDAHLVQACKDEITTLCKSEKDADFHGGQVEECLKQALADGHVTRKRCQEEVIRILTENRADIQVDPLLHRACAMALKTYCHNIPQGEGRQMSCLLSAREDSTVRLPSDCRKMLQDRVTMWEYAAKVAPPDTLEGLYIQVAMSRSRNYFLTIIFIVVAIILLCGMMCGRTLKRIPQSHKNK